MPYGTILDSGFLVGTGSTLYIPAVQGASWLNVINYTNAGLTSTTTPVWQIGDGLEFNWRAGMKANDCTVILRSDVTAPGNVTYSTAQALTEPGITYYAPSGNVGPLPATPANAGVTAIGAGPASVVTSTFAWPTTLVAGDIVRLYNTVGAMQLGAIDFTVDDITANTSFALEYMPAIAAAAAPGATAFWRKVPYDAYFYPQHRYISAIAADPNNGTQSIVTLTVTHGYTIGQTVRFMVPPAYGMTQISEIQPAATIVNINAADANGFTNTITVNVNIGGFTPFVFPATAAYPFTPAMVVPVGMNESEALYPVAQPSPIVTPFPPYNDLTDATTNTLQNTLALGAGASSPAGIAGNVIYWVLGTSYSL
jgi:hypothetical protein